MTETARIAPTMLALTIRKTAAAACSIVISSGSAIRRMASSAASRSSRI